jgi:cell division protein FtsA
MRKGVLYWALDITAGKIAGVCAAVKRTTEIVAIAWNSGQSAGIKDGCIQDVGALSEAIIAVLKGLSDLSGARVKSLSVSMQGPHIKSTHSIGAIPVSERGHKIITSGDIEKVNQQAYNLGLDIEERVLHQIAQDYTVDNQSRIINPAGLYGHKLEVDLLLITARNSDVENLISAVDRAGCRVRTVVLSAYAASLAAVADTDKAKGCVFLDMGFDTTQILVFKEGIVRGFEAFGIGSSHITEALARELRLAYDVAETVKISYGNALSHHIAPEAEVLIRKEQVYRPIKRREICLVIEKELEAFFEQIKRRLEIYQKTWDFPVGIIASGKIALLDGFLESLERCFNMPVRLAKIEPVPSQTINNTPLTDLTYATALGAVRHAVSQGPNIDLFRLSSYGNVFQKIMRKSKEIYQEYF